MHHSTPGIRNVCRILTCHNTYDARGQQRTTISSISNSLICVDSRKGHEVQPAERLADPIPLPAGVGLNTEVHVGFRQA